MKPHLIMPMGGAGSRFYKNGFVQPKPLIEINGKPFFYWAVMSIKKYVDLGDLIFVVLQQHIKEFELDKVIKQYFPDAIIKVLPEILPGPVFTSIKGVEDINDDGPVIFNDCDHMFKCAEVNFLLNNDLVMADGVLLTFESDQPHFSYVKYDDSGAVIGTIEKMVVSNHAICGAYIFRNVSVFLDAAERYTQNCVYSECFMSGLYNIMHDNELLIKDILLDYHVEFGTPEEYEKAKGSMYFGDLE